MNAMALFVHRHLTLLAFSMKLVLSASSLLLLLITLSVCPTSCVATTNVNATGGGNSVSIENDVLHFSYELERWLDTTVRPCQDFYSYVCGKSFNGTEAQLSTERLQQAQQQKFDEFLSMENNEHLMDAELKLKQFYISCNEARSLDDLKSTLMYRNSGGWPAIDDVAAMIRKRRNMTWMGAISAFHEAGFEYFFKTRIEIKSNKRIVHLEPDTSMHFTLRKFEQLASEILENSGVEATRSRLVELEIMNFERNRREIINSEIRNEQELEFRYESFKSALFGDAYQLQWDMYFKRTLGKTPRSNDTVLIQQMPKLIQFIELLQNTTLTRFLNWIWLDYLMDKRISECQQITRHYFEPVYQYIVERAIIEKVEMVQMYAMIGRAYDELLPKTSWIDEMTQQQSKHFLGRIMHLTLNGDSQLDSDYADLTITKRNFYRNLEKMQRHLTQHRNQLELNSPMHESHGITQAASEFMKVLLTVGALLQRQNLTTPLNYVLVGERFAEYMVASGSSSTTPGAWRSMDSEHEFSILKQCLNRQSSGAARSDRINNNNHSNYNVNDLLLRILAQHQTLHALDAWRTNNDALWRRLDRLLTAGRLQLTLRKLYFVGALLTNCHHKVGISVGAGIEEQRQFAHNYLRNSQDFTQTFGCRLGDELYSRNSCKIL